MIIFLIKKDEIIIELLTVTIFIFSNYSASFDVNLPLL